MATGLGPILHPKVAHDLERTGVQLLQELLAAIGEIRSRSAVRAVLLSSNVPGTFCAGADLKVTMTSNPLQSKQQCKGLLAPLRTEPATAGRLHGALQSCFKCCSICADIDKAPCEHA